MLAKPFEKEDGFRMWLDQTEVSLLLSRTENQTEEIAFTLGVRSGLRCEEITKVEAQHVVDTSACPKMRFDLDPGS